MICPCNKCPKKGCGRQATCKDYMDFWHFNREKNKRQIAEARKNAYVVEAIQKCKEGRHGSWKAYRKVDEK